MDQEMPVMDGLTCTRKIRELEQEGKLAGHVPIIAVTANARAEQVQTALDAGMVCLLFNQESLILGMLIIARMMLSRSRSEYLI